MPSDETKPEDTSTTEPESTTPTTEPEAAEKAPETTSEAPVSAEAEAASASTEADESAKDESEAEASVTPAAAVATPAATPAVQKKPEAGPTKLTPGQRLAAQKAAKASKKSSAKMSRKEEEEAARAATEILSSRPAGEPDEAEVRVAETRTYVASHSKQVIYAGAAIAAAFFLWFGFEQYSARQDAAAGRLLFKASEAARAEIREEPIENDRSRRLTFRTVAARDAEAIRRYRKVISEASSSDAALRARLGLASILVSQGKLTEAKTLLTAVAGLRGDDVSIGAQAVEGLGVIELEQRHWAQAKTHFEELRGLDSNRYQHVANYFLARTLHAQGRPNEAKPKLRALIDALEEADAPSLPYVKTQAELLLQQIDPSTARPRPAGLGAGGINLDDLGAGGQIPPELLEQLQRQMQQQQQGGAPQ